MNECENLQEQIDDYLGGRLSAFAAGRVESHLRQCLECTREVADYRAIIEELRAAARETAIEPSLPLQYSLDRIGGAPPRKRPSAHIHFSLIIAGLLLVALALVGGFGKITAMAHGSVIATLALIGMISLSLGLARLVRGNGK